MTISKFTLTTSGALFAAAAAFAPATLAACPNCGTVVEVKTIEKKGDSSGGGAVIGGVAGGVVGHQIGSGRGNTAATVLGAVGGAVAGNEIEKNRNKTTSYQVIVKLEDGKTRYFTFNNPTSYQSGDKIKVVDNKLVRR
jgi:outer membrane lipoprotein SlyB